MENILRRQDKKRRQEEEAPLCYFRVGYTNCSYKVPEVPAALESFELPGRPGCEHSVYCSVPGKYALLGHSGRNGNPHASEGVMLMGFRAEA